MPEDDRVVLERSRTFSFRIVGSSFYQANMVRFVGRGELDATIEHELTNEHDKNAIKVSLGGLTVGYFPRDYAGYFVEWIGERRYEGRKFKAPVVVVRAEVDHEPWQMLFADLAILASPPRVVGDLDRQTKKAINLVLKQSGARCVAHMEREKSDPAVGTLNRLSDEGFFARSPCEQCSKQGYRPTNAAYLAKFGHDEAYVKANIALPTVSGW